MYTDGILKNRDLYPHKNSMLAMSKRQTQVQNDKPKSQHWRSLAPIELK